MKTLLTLLLFTSVGYGQIQESVIVNHIDRIGDVDNLSLIHNKEMGLYVFTYFNAKYKKLMEIGTFSFNSKDDLDILYNELLNDTDISFDIYGGTLFVEHKKGKARMLFSKEGYKQTASMTEWLDEDSINVLFGI